MKNQSSFSWMCFNIIHCQKRNFTLHLHWCYLNLLGTNTDLEVSAQDWSVLANYSFSDWMMSHQWCMVSAHFLVLYWTLCSCSWWGRSGQSQACEQVSLGNHQVRDTDCNYPEYLCIPMSRSNVILSCPDCRLVSTTRNMCDVCCLILPAAPAGPWFDPQIAISSGLTVDYWNSTVWSVWYVVEIRGDGRSVCCLLTD